MFPGIHHYSDGTLKYKRQAPALQEKGMQVLVQ